MTNCSRVIPSHALSIPLLNTSVHSSNHFHLFICYLSFIPQITSARDDSELTESLNEESNFLIECGISKLTWSFSEKENLKSLLCKSIVIYRAKAALDQFVEGLQSVGLLSYIKRYPGVLRKVFCNPPTPLSVKS